MTPPYGYQLIDNGELQNGDMFWSINARTWMPVAYTNIGREIDESVRICRPESEMTNYDGVTGYYSCIERSPGAYETVACHDDVHPHHDELLDLANKFGKKVVLMKSQIVDEAELQTGD